MYKVMVFFLALFLINPFFLNIRAQNPVDLFNHANNQIKEYSIKGFQVLGERASGTSYVARLIHSNIPDLEFLESMVTSPLQKHFISWYIKKNIRPNDYVNLLRDDIVYIVVIRDVFDWLRSFYKVPNHIEKKPLKKGFSHFIRASWAPKRPAFFDRRFIPSIRFFLHTRSPLFYKKEQEFWKHDPKVMMRHHKYPDYLSFWLDQKDPITNRPFKNPLVLRTRKYQNYIALKQRISNVIFVRYEDVLKYPESFLEYMAQITKKTRSPYQPIASYKGGHTTSFQPREYFPISRQDQKFILSEIDQDLEKQLGYDYSQLRQ